MTMQKTSNISAIVNELYNQEVKPLEIYEFLISMTDNFEEVRGLTEKLFKLGIKPGKKMFKFMLALTESYENADYTIKLMKKYNVIPDSTDCIRWISLADNEEQANRVIEEMKLLGIELNPAIYGGLMEVQSSFIKAKVIFEELKLFQPQHSHTFYYTLINKSENSQHYNEVLSDMVNAGVKFDNDLRKEMTQRYSHKIIVESTMEYRSILRERYKSRFPNVIDMLELHKNIDVENTTNSETTLKLQDAEDNTNNFADFISNSDSPILYKNLGKSQYSDGVRIDKSFHEIFNPSNSPYYVKRGTARKVSILFNNKVFQAEYRYENQSDKQIDLQSIRFRKELKIEFKKVFPLPQGEFTIKLGKDINHFIFTILSDSINYDDDSLQFPEGRKAYRMHRVIERNPAVIKLAKERFAQSHNGKIFCEVCGMDFSLVYSDRGDGFIEGHHRKAVSDMKEGEMTKVEDIAMLCSNCHRMIHRPPLITIEELASIVNGYKKCRAKCEAVQ